MTNVAEVRPKGEKAAILVMDDGVEVWTPELEKAKELIGKPIPADWTQKQGEYGPQAFPPRPKTGGGAPAAWRNTKEGFEAEQAGRLRWQEREQDGLNRRTALMQATAWYCAAKDPNQWPEPLYVEEVAESFYLWLRKDHSYRQIAKDSASPTPSGAADGGGAGTAPSPPTSPKGEKPDAVGQPGLGKAGLAPSGCEHALTSDLDPLGKPLRPGWLRCAECGLTWKETA